MIVAIGFKSDRPPARIKNLLSGPLLTQSSIFGRRGFMRYKIQDLEAYRDEKGNIMPIVGMDEIEWRLDGELLIGEVK